MPDEKKLDTGYPPVWHRTLAIVFTLIVGFMIGGTMLMLIGKLALGGGVMR